MQFFKKFPTGFLLKFSLSFTVISGIGCTPVKPYWYNQKTGANLIPYQQDPKFDKDLRVVEFDELGDLWSVKQQEEAVRFIRKKKNPFVIVFVHGWRNSAEPENSDLNGFNKFVKEFKETGRHKNIAAIYVSWRGAIVAESKTLPYLTAIPAFLSVWDRKEATDRLASIPMNDTFWKIKNATSGKVFLIGHSYGGRIVERCVGTSLVGSNYEKGAANRSNLPADLIMLINPASEGLYARQMKRALDGWKDTTPPGIISVTANSDTATGWAWGAALNLASFGKAWYGDRTYPPEAGRARSEKQSRYLTSTAGHDSRLIDWEVAPCPAAPGDRVHAPPSPGAPTVNDNLSKSAERRWFWITSQISSKRYGLYKPKPPANEEDKNPSKEANGYWVLEVPREILNGHGGEESDNGIFNPRMQALTAGLFAMSHDGPSGYKAPTKTATAPVQTAAVPVVGQEQTALANSPQTPPQQSPLEAAGALLTNKRLSE